MTLDLSRYHDLFASESRDHLAVATRILERAHGALPDGDAFDELFRRIHSLKGMAATMGCHDIARLADAFEDVLEGVRDGHLRRERVPPDLAWSVLDRLETLLDAWTDPDVVSPPETAELISRMRALAGKPDAQPRTNEPDAPRQPPTLTVDLVVVPDPERASTAGSLAIIRALGELGEIVRFNPPPTYSARPGAERWVLRLRTELDLGDVRSRISRLPGVARVEARRAPTEPDRVPRPRPPIAHVRVRADHAEQLQDWAHELRLAHDAFAATAQRLRDPEAVRVATRCRDLARHLDGRVRDVLMVPFESIEPRLRAAATTTARALGRTVEMCVDGRAVGVDRSLLESMLDPLVQLVRNAVAHGIEPPTERVRAGKPPIGRIRLAVRHLREKVRIDIEDDGRGVDTAAVRLAAGTRAARDDPASDAAVSRGSIVDLLGRPGVSTAIDHAGVAGRGVGMSIVRREVARLRGRMRVRSRRGRGTTFTIELPCTRTIVPSIVLQAGGELFAVPTRSIERTIAIDPASVRTKAGKLTIDVAGTRRPLRALVDRVRTAVPGPTAAAFGAPAILPRGGTHAPVYHFEALLGRRELLVQPVDDPLARVDWLDGASILENGQLVLVLEEAALVPGSRDQST